MKQKNSKKKTKLKSGSATTPRPEGQLATNTRRTDSPYPIWGLTGGIASGKSTAARYFIELGIPVVDADQIGRGLSEEGGAAHPMILQRFGTSDRAKLRALIFSDPGARKDLEAILHPLIRTESLKEFKKLGGTGAVLIYEAALLVETGRYLDFDGLIVVSAPPATRIQRLVERDGISSEMAQSILNAQLSEETRKAAATVILENSGALDDLREKVQALAEKLTDRSS